MVKLSFFDLKCGLNLFILNLAPHRAQVHRLFRSRVGTVAGLMTNPPFWPHFPMGVSAVRLLTPGNASAPYGGVLLTRISKLDVLYQQVHRLFRSRVGTVAGLMANPQASLAEMARKVRFIPNQQGVGSPCPLGSP